MVQSSRSAAIISAPILLLGAIANPAAAAPSAVTVVQSSAPSSERLVTKPSLSWTPDDASMLPTVTIYPGTTQQQIEGFGGAFTEASARVLQPPSLAADKRSEVLTKLFSPSDGIGYSVARAHMGSNDFSTHPYTYDDSAGDTNLDTFSIQDDFTDLIPLISDAAQIPGASFKLLASPWSAPAWMKDNNALRNGGKLKPEYYATWANYFLKYLEAYDFYGIRVWGVTAQNEPFVTSPWESMRYDELELTRFIDEYLGPTLAAGGYGQVKILSGDDQKNHIMAFADAAASVPQLDAASDYVWGIAAHWYAGDWFEQVDEASIRYPMKNIFGSEAAIYPGVQRDQWENAGRYAHDIIGDLNNGAVGWIDWNIALNQNGGPNNVGISNPCSAPVIVSGGNYFLNPQYYAVGHFSKYVRPGDHKVGNITSGDARIDASAFRKADQRIVVVVYNGNSESTQIKLKDGDSVIRPTLPAGSITTFTYAGSNAATYPAVEKISLRSSNGNFVSNVFGAALSPDSSSVGKDQTFLLYYKPDGYVTLKSLSNELYVSVSDGDKLVPTAPTASTQIIPNTLNPYLSFERYELIDHGDGNISLKALKNGKYVTSELGAGDLEASASAIGSSEIFTKAPAP